MRFVGVSLMLFGAAVLYYLGIKGEQPATLRQHIFDFFHIPAPSPVIPAAQATP